MADEIVAAEKPRLMVWQKFPMDQDVLRMLHSMLDIPEDQELPEELWKIMGLHKAMEWRFIAHSWSYLELANMIVQSQSYSRSFEKYRSDARFVPGDSVSVPKHGRDGIYWCSAPLHRHLINCHGDLFLVKTDEIVQINKVAAVEEALKNVGASPSLLDLYREELSAEQKAIVTEGLKPLSLEPELAGV